MNEVRKLLLGKWSQWGPKHSSEETPWGPRVGGDAVRTETVVVHGGFASFFCRRTREATEEAPSRQRETSSVVGLEPSCDGARESLSLVMGFDRWRRRRRRKRRHEERDGRIKMFHPIFIWVSKIVHQEIIYWDKNFRFMYFTFHRVLLWTHIWLRWDFSHSFIFLQSWNILFTSFQLENCLKCPSSYNIWMSSINHLSYNIVNITYLK